MPKRKTSQEPTVQVDLSVIGLPDKLFQAAEALLNKIDNITTEQFSHGEEREEREALRAVIEEWKSKLSDK